MPEDTPAAPPEPALGFSITANITDRSQIVIQSFIPRDASDDAINELLDKVWRACDRQQAKYMLKDLRLKAELEELALQDQVKKFDNLQNSYVEEFNVAERQRPNGRQREFKLSTTQAAAVANAQKTIEAMKFNVGRYKTNLAELEAMAK